MANNAKVIAIYSLKGGVGKTTMAVNLAAEAALRRGAKTLIWDLDPQSAASFVLGHEPEKKPKARSVFERDIAPNEQTCRHPLWRKRKARVGYPPGSHNARFFLGHLARASSD